MPGAEAFEVVLHAFGQRVVGRGHADPAGVATTRRQDLGVSHGDNRRAGQEALVVVPHISSIAQFGVDHGDLFKALTQVRVEGVYFRLTEIPCNRQMLLGFKPRDVQYQGFMFDECGLERRQCFWQYD
ncbi:hypothetical protein D9M71_730380 [compost metagenome]